MIAFQPGGDLVERLVPGDRREFALALGAGAAQRRRDALGRMHQLGVAVDLGAGKAGRVRLIRVALDAHDLAVLDMGHERAHVGTIVRTDNANGNRGFGKQLDDPLADRVGLGAQRRCQLGARPEAGAPGQLGHGGEHRRVRLGVRRRPHLHRRLAEDMLKCQPGAVHPVGAEQRPERQLGGAAPGRAVSRRRDHDPAQRSGPWRRCRPAAQQRVAAMSDRGVPYRGRPQPLLGRAGHRLGVGEHQRAAACRRALPPGREHVDRGHRCA